MVIDVFPGHRLLAREYLSVLFERIGPKVETRINVSKSRAPADLAFVSDLGEWSRDAQHQLLARYERIFVLWWNNERELFQSVSKNREISDHQGIVHLFFFDEACKAVNDVGYVAAHVMPVFTAMRRFEVIMPLLSRLTRRYLVAMEVSWSTSHGGCESRAMRFEQANMDRRQFLSLISRRREDFFLVGPDTRFMGNFSLGRVPQRNPGPLQIMPLLTSLSCGIIELGSKSGWSSITPRLTDALAVGTPAHVLELGSEKLAVRGVTWHPTVESLATLPKPLPISRLEREAIRSSLGDRQLEEAERVLHLIQEECGEA